MINVEVRNLKGFQEEIKQKLNKEISPFITKSTKKGFDIAIRETPVATGLLKQKIKLLRTNKLNRDISSSRIFIDNPGKYAEVLAKMEYGFKARVVISEIIGLWDWVVVKNLETKFSQSGLMNIGFSVLSPFYGGGKNPIQIARNNIVYELERKLKIKFK